MSEFFDSMNPMNTAELISHIRPAWFASASTRLAHDEQVRLGFLEQLNRFYDLLEGYLLEGEVSGFAALLDEWIAARVQTGLAYDREASVSPLVEQLFMLVFEAARLSLPPEEALNLIWMLLPLKSQLIEHLTQRETGALVSRVTAEMEKAAQALEQLDQSKSDFISIAAHELKTPLTLIEGYLSMLRDKQDLVTSGIQEELLIDGIQSGAQRLKEIIADLTMVSMIDNQLLSLHFQPYRIGHLLDRVCDEFSNHLNDRKIRIGIIRFVGSEDITYGDETHLFQAFCNVVSNAIKYTPDGGSIHIDGRLLPGFYEVRIRDTGIGIAPEDQERIFEKFGRLGKMSLHSSGKTKFLGGGPGLGLPISRGIFEAHGGTIWVESAGYDEASCPGTTFHILLPVLDSPPSDRIASQIWPRMQMNRQESTLSARPAPASKSNSSQ